MCDTAVGWLVTARVWSTRGEERAGAGSLEAAKAVNVIQAVAIAAAEAWDASLRGGPDRSRDRESLRLVGVAAASLARLVLDAAGWSSAVAAYRERLLWGGEALQAAAECVTRLLAAPAAGDVTADVEDDEGVGPVPRPGGARGMVASVREFGVMVIPLAVVAVLSALWGIVFAPSAVLPLPWVASGVVFGLIFGWFRGRAQGAWRRLPDSRSRAAGRHS